MVKSYMQLYCTWFLNMNMYDIDSQYKPIKQENDIVEQCIGIKSNDIFFLGQIEYKKPINAVKLGLHKIWTVLP